MIKYWRCCLPFTIGLILSVTFILFMVEFIRGIDFEDLEFTLYALPYLGISIISGIVGIPLTLFGIERLCEKNA